MNFDLELLSLLCFAELDTTHEKNLMGIKST